MAEPFKPGLEAIRLVNDPGTRASLLLDLIEGCQLGNCLDSLEALLEEVRNSSSEMNDVGQRASLLLRLARLQQQRGDLPEARTLLDQALQAARESAAPASAEVMLRIAVALDQAGEREQAAALWRQFGPSRGDLEQQRAEFPFEERPLTGEAGFAVSGDSSSDTTFFASLDLGLYKQWPRHDIELDLLLAADYDDSRDYDFVRPQILEMFVLRHHLDEKFNLFLNQLTSLNMDILSADNDDEGNSLISTTLAGAGVNLWRGDNAASFQEIQLGVGGRYRFDDINLEQSQDQLDLVVGVVYRTREVPIWIAMWDQTLEVVTSPSELGDLSVWSSTRLVFPFTDSWSWSNEFIIRYELQRPNPDYPPMWFQFFTGLTYSF